MIKSNLLRCATCKRNPGKTLRGPESPELPTYRLSTEFAFQTTGLDFAGPLYVKDICGKDSTMHKAYILLFTCATTRNIHLELTPSMEAPSVIRTLKRFLARRGIIKMFIRDKFRSFIAEDLKRFLRTLEIEWSYIFAKSPWWGGFYERMVRTVKSSLRKTLGRARLNYEEMETVTSEIEMIINSRPLTYIQDDVEEVLTPSHLIDITIQQLNH